MSHRMSGNSNNIQFHHHLNRISLIILFSCFQSWEISCIHDFTLLLNGIKLRPIFFAKIGDHLLSPLAVGDGFEKKRIPAAPG